MSEKTHILRRGVRPEPRTDTMMHCFAAVPRGSEEITATELERLGIQGGVVTKGGVSFTTDRTGLYRANLWLRTASRVLVTLAVTGGSPIARSAGNVISVPAPTTAFIPPATKPAARIAVASRGVTRWSLPGAIGRVG